MKFVKAPPPGFYKLDNDFVQPGDFLVWFGVLRVVHASSWVNGMKAREAIEWTFYRKAEKRTDEAS